MSSSRGELGPRLELAHDGVRQRRAAPPSRAPASRPPRASPRRRARPGVLVRMRGLSRGSLERSQTRPRLRVLTSTGPKRGGVAVELGGRRGPRRRARRCGTEMSAAGRPGRVRTKAATSAAVEVSGPLLPQQPLGQRLRLVGAVERVLGRSPRTARSRTGGPGGARPRPRSSWRTSHAHLVEVVRGRRCRTGAAAAASRSPPRRGSPRARPAPRVARRPRRA